MTYLEFSPDECIQKLADISASLIEAVVNNNTGIVENLVIEQVQWLKQMPAERLNQTHRAQLHEIMASIHTQQKLIGQALSVSEFYLQRSNEQRPFDRIG